MGLDMHYGLALDGETPEAEVEAKMKALLKVARKVIKAKKAAGRTAAEALLASKVGRFTGPEVAMEQMFLTPLTSWSMDVCRRGTPELGYCFVIVKDMPNGDFIPFPIGVVKYASKAAGCEKNGNQWFYAGHCSLWGELTDILAEVMAAAPALGFKAMLQDEGQPERSFGSYEEIVPEISMA